MAHGKLEFARGEIIASKYEVVDPLEESPLGHSYRVKHQKSGKFVRLTLLRPKIAGQAQKEQLLDIHRRTKDLQHPGLLKVGELGEHEGVAYVTFEDFEARTLRELLSEYRAEGKRFETREAAQIVIQLLEALSYLHQAGFVHRALRPEYVLIQARHTGPRNRNFVARVKMMHAGLWDLVPAGTLAEDEFSRGEAQYLAPELKSFEPNATPASDIYSVGVIYYETLTGTPPVGTYQAPSSVRSDIPRFVNDMMELALANTGEDRYRSAADFLAAIQRTVQEEPVEDDAPRSWTGPAVALGVGALFTAAVAFILWKSIGSPDDESRAAEAKDISLRNQVAEQAHAPSQAEIQAILRNHPPGMNYVPAGPFISGRMHSDSDGLSSEPLAQVVEQKAFLIDRYEAPNLQGGSPRTEIDYPGAEKLCASQGKRLCTALEWEKACKGPLNSIYAYQTSIPADVYDPVYCGAGLEERGFPSGSKPECQSGYGVFDMSGNFREWTSTEVPGKPTRRLVKGGIRQNPSRGGRCAMASDEFVQFLDSSMGTRCCRDVDAPPVAPEVTPPATPPTP